MNMKKSYKIGSIKDKFELYNKEDICNFAGQIGMHGYSKLKKNELIDAVVDFILDPDVMFYRLSIFDDRAITIFENSISATYEYPEKDHDIVATFNMLDYAVIGDNKFFVPRDVGAAFMKVKGEKFDKYRKRASWVYKCFRWVEHLYGYAPEDIVLKLVNLKKFDMDKEELEDIYDHFPYDQLWTVKVDFMYMDDLYVDNLESLRQLRMMQGEKDYYIPTIDEIEEFYENLALISGKPYQDMLGFLQREFGMTYYDAEDILLEQWDDISSGGDPHESMQNFWNNFQFRDDKQIHRIVELYNNLSNNTRMKSNRGFTPNEMARMMPYKPGQPLTIVLGSSKAAEMLAKAAPEMRKMGMSVDFESNADTLPVISMPYGPTGEQVVSQKKIYPNDQCPCGSGKKYKKCCGRK
ncbi:SEC-C motif-containing protein [Butyrivibrio sp. INlla14]|nr:SEC-C metal-binding domain-containing protein [Butyrivibrio sp. INlla14]SCY14457.1 SEC-C motif-containing protein [Butyrivibrio sp. INlla14]